MLLVMPRLRTVALLAMPLTVVLASHLHWAALDLRAPWDQGLFYAQLPRLWLGVQLGELDVLARGMVQPGGWLSGVMALWFSLFGRSVPALHALLLLQVGALLALVGAIAHRRDGLQAGVVAIALTGAAPLVFGMGRTPWLHVTEAVLALGSLAALERDRPHLASALLLPLLLLRPSSLVWAAPLGLWLFWRHRRWPWLLGWGLAAVPVLLALPDYLRIKVDARGRYADTLPPLHQELLDMLGPHVLIALLAGLLLRRRRPENPIALAWVVLALTLSLGFASGVFNHTLLAPGLALLAAPGLAAFGGRASIGVGAALGVLVVSHGALLLPAGSVPVLPAWSAPATPWTWLRPWKSYGVAEAHALLTASCPSNHCVVAVDQGLYTPFSEEVGSFENFVTNVNGVVLQPALTWAERPARADALAWWACEGAPRAEAWQERHRGTREGLGMLIARQRLQPAWVVPAGEDCALVWHSRDGEVLRPERLPPGYAPDSEAGVRAIAALPPMVVPPLQPTR